jgi:hypothetical protein
MPQTRPDSRQIINRGALKQLGAVASTTQDSINSKINVEFNYPLRPHATFPTPDAKLNFSDSVITASNGAQKVVSSVNNQTFTNLSGLFINFQTQALSNASHFNIIWPVSNTVGFFRRAGFTLVGSGKIQVTFSAQVALLTSLPDPATVIDASGLPIGYVDLECTNVAGYFKTAGSTSNIIEDSKIYRFSLGGGSGGSGNSDSLLEDLKNQLNDSYYQFLTGQSFAQSQNLVDNVNTTATFNFLTNSYIFTTGQKVTTINLLDSEFFNTLKDVDQALVTLRYVGGSVDTTPTVRLTRDNGVTWQTVIVSRNGSSDEVSGIINFANETLSQTASYTVTSGKALNTTTQQKLAQILTIPANTLRMVKQFTFDVTKVGSPSGSLIVKLVKEASGNPSLQSADIVSVVEKAMSTISSGAVTVDFGKQILSPGNYYLLFETDAFYTELQIRTNAILPDAKKYNGTAWSAVSGEAIQCQYTYKDLVLKLEITASGTSSLAAFGVLYQKLTELVSPTSYDQIIVGNSLQVDAGLATHSSLQNALSGVGFAKRIKFLAGTVTETVTMSQSQVVIEGNGANSILSGNVTISGNYNTIEKLRIVGNLTLTGKGNMIRHVVVVDGIVTNNGLDNDLSILWVTSDEI